MITFLLSLLVRLVILCAVAYAFIVLFEHGPGGFLAGLTTEWKVLLEFFRSIPVQLAGGS